MSDKSTDNIDLNERLNTLMSDDNGQVAVADIKEAVEAVLGSLKGELTPVDMSLYLELESLGHFIETAKHEIASLRPDEVNEQFIPTATDELDAIVDTTAVATNSIMDCAEAIEAEIPNVPKETGEIIMNATTNIFEACGFQDITGQRITKVVSTLKVIEDRIEKLIDAFGGEIAQIKEAQSLLEADTVEKEIVLTDEDLLAGPQHANKASSQAEIDALLASFD